jgi:hypothetical protein
MELYLHSPNTPSWRAAQLKKHRDNFIIHSFKEKDFIPTILISKKKFLNIEGLSKVSGLAAWRGNCKW